MRTSLRFLTSKILFGPLIGGSSIVFAVMLVVTIARADMATRPSGQLKVLTWNVWGIPLVTPDRSERIGKAAAYLAESEADIIAVQEAWLTGDVARLRSGMEAVGFHGVHFRSFFFGSGLILFSRLPMLSTDFRPFHYEGKPFKPWHGDWYAGKGFGSAVVETSEGPLVLINTHLHASYKSTQYLAGQVSQMVELARGLGRLTEQGRIPCLVMGDLNAQREALPFRLLSEMTTLRPAPRAPDGFDWILAQSGIQMKCEIIQTRKLPMPTLDTGVAVSDHRPVVGIVRMKNTAASTQAVGSGPAAREAREVLVDAAWRALFSCLLAATAAGVMIWFFIRLRRSGRRLVLLIIGACALILFLTVIYQAHIGFVFVYSLSQLSAQT